jgi:hypothetical protein
MTTKGWSDSHLVLEAQTRSGDQVTYPANPQQAKVGTPPDILAPGQDRKQEPLGSS